MEYSVLLKGNNTRTSIGALGASTVTLVESHGERILIDVTHYGRRRLLLDALSKKNLSPKDIDVVILTHLHWDHALNVDLFKNSRIYVSEKELDYNNRITEEDPFTIRNFKKLIDHSNIVYTNGGDRISNEVKILDTRGHTEGHLSVAVGNPNKGFITTGDSITNMRAWNRNRPDIVMFDEKYALKSVEEIKKLGYKLIIPGHDPPFTVSENSLEFTETEKVEIIFREDREKDFRFTFSEDSSKKGYL